MVVALGYRCAPLRTGLERGAKRAGRFVGFHFAGHPGCLVSSSSERFSLSFLQEFLAGFATKDTKA